MAAELEPGHGARAARRTLGIRARPHRRGPVGRRDGPDQRRRQGAAVSKARNWPSPSCAPRSARTRGPASKSSGLSRRPTARALHWCASARRSSPRPSDAQIRFADPVVLIRSPFRVTFSYAGPDQVWQPNWRGQKQLPDKVRIAVRNGATGQLLGRVERRHRSRQRLGRMRAGKECGRMPECAAEAG